MRCFFATSFAETSTFHKAAMKIPECVKKQKLNEVPMMCPALNYNIKKLTLNTRC